MPDHQPERPHDPEHSQLSEMELRVRALESVLSIRRHTLGCRAMYVVASESLRASMAVTSSRTPTRLAEAKIRNGSILYGSMRVISGAPTQIQTFAYRWTHGSHIWSRPSKLPKAYWCILPHRTRYKSLKSIKIKSSSGVLEGSKWQVP